MREGRGHTAAEQVATSGEGGSTAQELWWQRVEQKLADCSIHLDGLLVVVLALRRLEPKDEVLVVAVL